MQMKWITYLTGLYLAIGLISCNKALDMAPAGKIELTDVFADEEKVGAFLNTCYNFIPSKGVRYYFWSRGPVEWSDEAWDTDAQAEPTLASGRVYNGGVSAGDNPMEFLVSIPAGNGNFWGRYWEGIRDCNLFLANISSAQVSSESQRERWTAEAHILRAYYYHELLKLYGAAIPILKTPIAFDADFSTLEKASFHDVAQFIIADCDTAIQSGALPWRITNGEAYRVTKAMGEAIKSRISLFAASPLYNQGEDYWEEAYQINKASLANLRSHGYGLYTELHYPETYQSDISFFGPDNNRYAAIYNEYFTKSMGFGATQIDKETIYETKDGQGNIWDIDGIGSQDGYKSGTCPTQEMVDAFETADGQPILDLEKPYLDEQHLKPNYNPDNTTYDPQDPYKNRDPRFYASIYYNGSKRKALWNFAETPESHENYPAGIGNRTRIIATYEGEPQTGISLTRRNGTPTGYYERKFLAPNSGNDNPVAGAHFKLFRLGEVILNYAEAAAEAGHLEEARAAVDEIRARVNMPAIPAGLSKAELVLRVHHERRVELAFEENRYFDLRRWSAPDGDLSATCKWLTAAAITRNADGSYTYDRKLVRNTPRGNYSNKYLWMPLPLGEANRLQSITGISWQNAGW